MKKNAKLEAIRRATPEHIKMQIDDSFAIVDRIWELMQKQGISQRELAERLGKKESQVSRWMRGTHNFTLSTLAEISEVLGERIIEVTSAYTHTSKPKIRRTECATSVFIFDDSRSKIEGFFGGEVIGYTRKGAKGKVPRVAGGVLMQAESAYSAWNGLSVVNEPETNING